MQNISRVFFGTVFSPETLRRDFQIDARKTARVEDCAKMNIRLNVGVETF